MSLAVWEPKRGVETPRDAGGPVELSPYVPDIAGLRSTSANRWRKCK
jgi:hypothetical protein